MQSSNYISVCCSTKHILIIDNSGYVWSCGDTEFGQTGHNKKTLNSLTMIPNITNIKTISCGYSHSVICDYEGNIWTFGSNMFGQLGIERKNISQSYLPQKLNLPPIDHISCGNNHTLCLTHEGDIYSFGYGGFGQLGINTRKLLSIPTCISFINNIEYIKTSDVSSYCKSISGDFYVWGDNSKGQLGINTNTTHLTPYCVTNWPDNIISLECGSYHVLLLTSDGIVYSFGSNIDLQLGVEARIKSSTIPIIVNSLPFIHKIECGYHHSMCIDDNNKLWMFGSNNNGQLGIGNILIKKSLPKINTQIEDEIIGLSHGGLSTCIKTINNKIYVFGLNIFSKSHEEYHIFTPKGIFNNEELWPLSIKSRQKSARK